MVRVGGVQGFMGSGWRARAEGWQATKQTHAYIYTPLAKHRGVNSQHQGLEAGCLGSCHQTPGCIPLCVGGGRGGGGADMIRVGGS
jgi:hypothetical protein